MKLFRYLLIYSNICLGNKIYIPYKFKKSICYIGLFEILYKEDFMSRRVHTVALEYRVASSV